MFRSSALALLLRRERSDLAALALVTLLIAFTAFVSVAGLRLFERAADDALKDKVAAAPVTRRTIQLATARTLFQQDGAPTVDDWHREGDRFRDEFPGPVQELVADGNLAIGSVRLRVSNPPDYPLFITLRYQDAFPDVAELVAGRWPASTGEELPPVAEFEAGPSGELGFPRGTTDHILDEPRRFEIAVLESSARSLGIDPGSVLLVGIDLVDPMFQSSHIRSVDAILPPTELEVTGLYRGPAADSDIWFGDPRIVSDDLGLSLDQPIASISAYVSPDALPGFVSSGLPFEYRWRFPILVDRLDAGAVGEVQRGFQLLESQSAGSDAGTDVRTEAGLLPLLERHTGLRDASEAVLATAASAPLSLAGGALAMAAALLIRRRRAPMSLASSRGASPRLLLAATLLESVVVAAVACLAGLGLAVALEPTAGLQPSLIATAVIGLIAVVVLAGAAWPQIRQPLAELERTDRPPRGANPRRVVAELSLVVMALLGAYLLSQRGISRSGVSFDPFLTAVPPLIAFAAGILAVRLYRPLMAAAGWVADRRRDLVPVLGVRAVARGSASTMPVLVLILAVAFATFMSVVATSVDRAQRTSSWLAVGADARLEPATTRGTLPSDADIAAVPGVAATAVGFADPRARAPSGTAVGTMTLLAVDAAAYAGVVAGSPVEPRWPQEFLGQPADTPIPAILGSRLAGGQLGLGQGDTFQTTVMNRAVQMQVVEVRSAMPGLLTDDSFVVVPYAWLENAIGQELAPSAIWVRVPEEAMAALAERTGAGVDEVVLSSRYGAYASFRDEPLVGALGVGFTVALGISIAYAVLTILGAVILSAGRRTRDGAILRTLGLSGGQQSRLTMTEHVPPIVLALPLGLVLGIGIAVAVAPALGLGALSGSSGSVPLVTDWTALALLSTMLAVVALVAIVLG